MTFYQKTLINFSLLTAPIKDTRSVCKTSTISKLENYIDENYGEAAKIQLKQTILQEVKQQLPNETKEKGHLDELLHSLHNQIYSLKSEIGFLREKVKEKNSVNRLLLRRNSRESNSSSPCESPKFDNISEINEECRDILQVSSNQIIIASLKNQQSKKESERCTSLQCHSGTSR